MRERDPRGNPQGDRLGDDPMRAFFSSDAYLNTVVWGVVIFGALIVITELGRRR